MQCILSKNCLQIEQTEKKKHRQRLVLNMDIDGIIVQGALFVVHHVLKMAPSSMVPYGLHSADNLQPQHCIHSSAKWRCHMQTIRAKAESLLGILEQVDAVPSSSFTGAHAEANSPVRYSLQPRKAQIGTALAEAVRLLQASEVESWQSFFAFVTHVNVLVLLQLVPA